MNISSRALAIATLVLWPGVVIVTQRTPVLRKDFGVVWLFAVLGINTTGLLLFVRFRVPETKGMLLEEIESCG